MTGRNRNQVTKLETTIEQCRGEGKWQRVFELADKLKSGYPQVESLANFLMGEGKLESYLEEYPPIEDNILKARHGLTDAKRYLNSVIGESGKKKAFLPAPGWSTNKDPTLGAKTSVQLGGCNYSQQTYHRNTQHLDKFRCESCGMVPSSRNAFTAFILQTITHQKFLRIQHLNSSIPDSQSDAVCLKIINTYSWDDCAN